MKRLLAKLGIGIIVLAGAGTAPILPKEGNGIISVAVFERADGSVFYEQLSDEQYAKMGEVSGASFNPATSTGKFVKAYQQPTDLQPALRATEADNASTTKEKQDVPPLYADKDLEWVSMIDALTPKAEAAIAFDSVASGALGNPVLSITFSLTNTAGDFLAVGAGIPVTDSLSGVTYNAVALTQAAKQQDSLGGGRWVYMYYLVSPATGTNNVVVSSSIPDAIRANATTYSGTSLTGQPDAAAQNTCNGADPCVVPITTSADNSWFVSACRSGVDYTVSSGGIVRGTIANGFTMADSNGPKTPAGATSISYNSSGVQAGCVIMSFKPSAGAAATFAPWQFQDF